MGKGLGSVVSVGAKMAMGGSPLGAFGGALAGQALSGMGGGGGGGGASKSINYGTGDQTYTIDGKPIDTSKYFIKGDKGVYNILPLIGGKTDSMAINKDILGALNGDAGAIAAYKKAFPTTKVQVQLGKDASPFAWLNGPQYKDAINYGDRLGVDLGWGPSGGLNTNPYVGQSDLRKISEYAQRNNNNVFMPWEVEQALQQAPQLPTYTQNQIGNALPSYGGLENQIAAAGGGAQQKLPAYNGLLSQIAAARGQQ